MTDFVAIDVETANNQPSSVCAIGAVKVTDGVISDRYYTLVRPTPNFYFSYFTNEIHGIGRKDTDCAPTFAEIWPDLKRFIGSSTLVAHNCRFDRGCLRAAAKSYGIEFPDNPFLCTLQQARTTIPKALCGSHSLPYLAEFLGIPFNRHHNALADAECCAKIAMTIL